MTSTLANLTAGTTYYIRAYVMNTAGTAFSEERDFTAIGMATLGDFEAENITGITATAASATGAVINTGGDDSITYGHVWSTSNIADGTDPDTITTKTAFTDAASASAYTSPLDGLTPGTMYYIRAYVTNDAGTSLSVERDFTAIGMATLGAFEAENITGITATAASATGAVTNTGGDDSITYGHVWSTSNIADGADPRTITTKTAFTDTASASTYTSTLADLAPGTMYYIRAYVTNDAGTSLSVERDFTTAIALASLGAFASTDITTSARSASAAGAVMNAGGATSITYGHVWSTSNIADGADPRTIQTKTVFTDIDSVSTYTSPLDGLTPGTMYYIRAYATNSAGTSLSIERDFTTIGMAALGSFGSSDISNIRGITASATSIVTDDGDDANITYGHVLSGDPIAGSTLNLGSLPQGVRRVEARNITAMGSYTNQISDLMAS